MEILIIGGTGNISTAVVRELARRGHSLTLVTRGSSASPGPWGHIAADRYDGDAFASALRRWEGDVIIDFLCYRPEHAEILYQTFRNRVRQHIFISTATVYKRPPEVDLPITEETPLGNPNWDYADNKHRCEEWYIEAGGPEFPTTIVRPSHTLGEGWLPSPAFSSDFTVAERIIEGKPVILCDEGKGMWTITAASDFAVGLAGLVGNEAALGEAFHITSDVPLSWNCLYYEMGRALGREPRIVYMPTEFLVDQYPEMHGPLKGDKAAHAVFDNLKIKRFVPEFECRMSPRDIIRENAAWRLAEGHRRNANPRTNQIIEDLLEKWTKSQ
ncbi:NAD-dependent epimerase/dehydratase family protein [bacterium]|nr:NAD-dependent epimerase/dehydratase family protein [bacterium]